MSSKKLLSNNLKQIFKDEYHCFLKNKRDSNNDLILDNLFYKLRSEYPDFKKFSNLQLSNQIIYSRNKEGYENWPKFEDYKNYISLTSRNFLKKSLNSCLLAVEIYNKPTINFRTENYIVLMMISWTSALHGLFEDKNIKYKDTEKDYYELPRCLEIYKQQKFSFEPKTISENIIFLYELRNEIVHRSASPIDEDVFGECQACLYNFQDFLHYYWGEEFQIGVSLSHSLQFSRSLREKKIKAMKKHELSKLKDINDFISTYKNNLKKNDPSVYNSPRFSFKVYMIPKLANKDKNSDIAVEFIKISDENDFDESYDNLLLAIKEVNARYFRPGEVSKIIQSLLREKYDPKIFFSASNHHARCVKYYKICEGKNTSQPHNTNIEYCRYNPTYDSYEYTNAWIEKLKQEINPNMLKKILKETKPTKSKKNNIL